jgi:hypothetical protein
MMGIGLAILGAVAALSAPGHAVTASCPSGVPTQTITVVNQANVRPAALAEVENAVAVQSLQLRAAWGTPCAMFTSTGGWPLYLTRSSIPPCPSTDPGCHWNQSGSIGIDVATGGWGYRLWSVYFSHEVMEVLADPTAVGDEVCDPVQTYRYETSNGVTLQAFAEPAYFAGDAGAFYDG